MAIFDWLTGGLKSESVYPERDFTKNLASCIKSRAELGDPKAQWNLGIMLTNGEGAPKDEAAGLKWLKKSAEQKFLDAEVTLGNLFLAGSSCCQQDYNEAMQWYFKAAGHASVELEESRKNRLLILHAISGLGYIYAKGKGLPSRMEEVIDLLSSNTKGVPIPYYLGYIFATGCDGQLVDEGKAVDWFLVMMVNDLGNSEDVGSPSGQRLLLQYSDQEGKRLDFNDIIKFIAKASSKGVAEAQYALGIAHWYGWRGLQQNKELAIQLFEYASAQGDCRAKKLLLQLSG